MNAGKLIILSFAVFALVCASGSVFPGADSNGFDQQSAADGVEYLARVMDEYHNRFPVYDDNSSAGNHFHALAKIPDENAAVANFGSYTGNTHSGATFYFDDIQYELSAERRAQRLNEPRFIRSFTTLPLQPDPNDANKDDDIDLVLRNAAFTYDNAVATLAFLADGGADSLRRAKLVGDAFVYATQHDRTFNDGRLRSAYGAGDIALPPGWTPNNRTGTTPIAGFYVETPQSLTFAESAENLTIDTGNNAWAMIALLALRERTGDARYLNAARQLGNLARGFRQNSGTYQGFLGGLELNRPETLPPTPRAYASTEHNIRTTRPRRRPVSALKPMLRRVRPATAR